MQDDEIHRVIQILRNITRDWTAPYVTGLARQSKDPFRVLVSTMLSLWTKDAVTAVAARRLTTAIFVREVDRGSSGRREKWLRKSEQRYKWKLRA